MTVPGRSKRIFLRAVTAAAGLVLALVTAELLLRVVGFQFALYPSRVQFGWPDPVAIKEMYRPDPQLLWVLKDYEERLADGRRAAPDVVFLGDSCTEFSCYDEEFQTRATGADSTAAFEILNLGTGGWSTYQGRRQLERDVVPLRPRIVTVYFGWNDHWNSFGIPDRQIGRFNLEHPALFLQLNRFRVVQLVHRALFSRTMLGQERDGRRPPRVSLDDFRANLTAMVATCRENSIVPVLLTAPTAHEKGREPEYLEFRWVNDLAELVPLHQAYVQAVREVARETGANLVDLAADFATLTSAERSQLFTEDGIHLSDEGGAKAADFLLAGFRAQGLLPLSLCPE